ncbi:hypothetical protein ACFVY0_46110 [Streptomyces sp. NPDC058286]|uniref:hypothetical protein n=1 Tax=Streptomyces sp. NPDC058286 TaxID=3346422 RepID=UPI0036ED1322
MADAIAQANGASVIANPRLALLETNLCREWVKFAQRHWHRAWTSARRFSNAPSWSSRQPSPPCGPSSRTGVRANLMVEQASVAGAKIYELLCSGPNGSVRSPMPQTEVVELVLRVLRVTTDSMSQATDRYYPVNVLCWVASDVFDKNRPA